MIWSLDFMQNNPPNKFAKKVFFPLKKLFTIEKNVLPYFWGEETLCFIFISFSFISNFYGTNYGLQKQNYLATVFLKSYNIVIKFSKTEQQNHITKNIKHLTWS